MGIESDQLVFDYLSKVGDLAQQRQLPSGTRMRLVTELRNEIDKRRAKSPVDTPAAVRRILSRLGSPDELVEAAGSGAGDSGDVPRAAVPVQRHPSEAGETGEEARPKGLRRMVPRPRPTEPAPEPDRDAPSPPHLASQDELGPHGSAPDWWRVDSGPFGLSDSVPGFVGGVEIPEILKPPPGREPKPEPEPIEKDEDQDQDDEEEADDSEAGGAKRRLRPRLRLTGYANPLLLLAAALLVAGAVLGNWFALGVGWLIAWASRRLTTAESKWAVLVMPGLAVAGGLVWLWGRTDGRWGAPIPEGHMSDAVGETWPWVVRAAALASAAYLVWRSQRNR
ncbi:hypothetical protein ACIQNU_21780 [Streptomyces sp. NPDC091292]|uniref:hypothetical protein n=1 Tax=Streptomyces sp. NPDC091292 TaxID=3365991 RepID=UPI0038205F49